MVQLKRFTFDFRTMQRLKLNDAVSFPLTLSLDRYVQDDASVSAAAAAATATDASTDASNGATGVASPRLAGDGDVTEGSGDGEAAGLDYNLVSILIHKGGALGGHYQAFVHSVADDKWYDCNDSVVTDASEDDIARVCGLTTGDGGDADDGAADQSDAEALDNPMVGARHKRLSSANAYMLVYRRAGMGLSFFCVIVCGAL